MSKHSFYLMFLILLLCSCSATRTIHFPSTTSSTPGSAFYSRSAAYTWQQRDSAVLEAFYQGNMPAFLKKFVPVHTAITDSATGRAIKATYYVSPDYFSIGTNDDWARVCITPMAAQKIADSLHCFLPTPKMVDDIYKSAGVKLTPVPMYAYRDSTPTMWQHHLIIEGQRRQRKGLIAGIKKDVVLSEKVTQHSRPNRVAIYGWHKPDGVPIQPVYAGHVNWYVDYSHGIRLVYEYIKVNGKNMHYTEVLAHPVLKRLLCGEELCNFYRY
ncbi:MAG TPA: hypothetical protein PKC69_08095 [Chitinophagaceae bacterium]|nr:hypothetical protein [Chitinophagaceae bacterium]